MSYNSDLLQSVANFMQQQDPNGRWSHVPSELKNTQEIQDFEDECYFTLCDWLKDGLECTKRVDGYLEYLSRNFHDDWKLTF